jgi:hypothetical protein
MALKGVRHQQAIHGFSRLCLMRRVDGVPISDAGFLAYQDALWPHLASIIEKQQADGAWAPLDQDRSSWFHTTPWILVFFGYLGLNGTVYPSIERAVAYFIDYLAIDGPQTYACRYAMYLRALLQLGFAQQPGVYETCVEHLEWMLARKAHCRATTRRGSTCCACALVKELLFLTEFPAVWRDARYERAVAASQKNLLATVDRLSECPANGRQWDEFGYFRHVCPSWFEAVEALVKSGYRDVGHLEPMLTRIASKRGESATWLCEYRAHRSISLDGKRRTVSWPMNLEPAGRPSPWLSVCAVEIAQALMEAGQQ